MSPLEWTIGPVNLVDALIAIGVAAGIFALLVVAQRVLLHRWGKFAAGTANSLDDDLVVVRRTQWWFPWGFTSARSTSTCRPRATGSSSR